MGSRIFRFGSTGLIFLLFLLFWYWEFAGRHIDLVTNSNDKIVTAIIGIVSLPGLGYFISSFYKELWEKWIVPDFFRPPDNNIRHNYYSIIAREFPIDPGVIIKDKQINVTD